MKRDIGKLIYLFLFSSIQFKKLFISTSVDIFDQEGKLKPEVINTIQKGVQEIKTQFPQLPY